MNYKVGTATGCHDLPNGEPAGCICLVMELLSIDEDGRELIRLKLLRRSLAQKCGGDHSLKGILPTM